MNQMIEAWKAIPDVPEEVLTPSKSHPSYKAEVAIDGRYPSRTPQITNKRSVPNSYSTTTATRQFSSKNSNKKTGPAMFRKLDRKKPNDQKLGIVAAPPLATPLSVDDHLSNMLARPETKRSLFNEIVDEEMQESEYENARISSAVVGSNFTEEIHKSHKDFDELSFIRNQLVQIETQQSNLFDLLQKFIGTSKTGMQSLETHVHSLELTLDEISCDLARSTGRFSNPEPKKTMCCKLPGADILASRLWKKTEIQHLNARISSAHQTIEDLDAREVVAG